MPSPTPSDTVVRNRTFYDEFWSRGRLIPPTRHHTWPLIEGLIPASPERIEIGPGLLPRLPIAGTHFVDLSAPVIARINAAGGHAISADLGQLPFADGRFDLAAGFDVFEHIDDDRGAFREMSRVLKPGGRLIFSVPVHPEYWTEFDNVVGHVRRYVPAELATLLEENGFIVEQSAGFGRKPSNRRVVSWGMWWLAHRPERAMWWYNRLILPMGLFFQRPLRFAAGLIVADEVQGLVLVCRKERRRG